jgi:hypothetical protein
MEPLIVHQWLYQGTEERIGCPAARGVPCSRRPGGRPAGARTVPLV